MTSRDTGARALAIGSHFYIGSCLLGFMVLALLVSLISLDIILEARVFLL